METFLQDVLDKIENDGGAFAQQAYQAIGGELLPVLRLLLILYVAHYGLLLITGTARIGVGDLVGRVVRMVFILLLVGNWQNFNLLLYAWADSAPETIGRAILALSSTGIDEPVQGLTDIWNTANRAAAVYSEQTGYETILPALISFTVIASAGLFVGTAVALLILAKIMLWVLVGTAPIFIACMLFEQSRRYGRGWLNQVLIYVITPLLVYTIAAFLVAVLVPYMDAIGVNAPKRRLNLTHLAPFILLCLAGAPVIFQVQIHARAITRGLETGLDRAAHWVMAWKPGPSSWNSGFAAPVGGAAKAYLPERHSAAADQRHTAYAQAMQNRISANSMPR